MHIDCKETIWNRTIVPDEYEEKIKEMLEEGKTLADLQQFLDEKQIYNGVEYLFETAESLEPSENGFQNTIELINKEGDTVWGNAKPVEQEEVKSVYKVNDILIKAEQKAYQVFTPQEYKVFHAFMDYFVGSKDYDNFLAYYCEDEEI